MNHSAPDEGEWSDGDDTGEAEDGNARLVHLYADIANTYTQLFLLGDADPPAVAERLRRRLAHFEEELKKVNATLGYPSDKHAWDMEKLADKARDEVARRRGH